MSIDLAGPAVKAERAGRLVGGFAAAGRPSRGSAAGALLSLMVKRVVISRSVKWDPTNTFNTKCQGVRPSAEIGFCKTTPSVRHVWLCQEIVFLLPTIGPTGPSESNGAQMCPNEFLS